MTGNMMAAAGVGNAAATLSFSGALTTVSASSPVTSATRTINASGTVRFDSISTDGGTPQYSADAGAFTNITEGGTVAVTTSLAVRATLVTVGFKATFAVRNNADSALIEAVTLTRS